MSMIERVAAAIVPPRCNTYDAKGHEEKEQYREAAIRAIKAMMEPTSEMIEAGTWGDAFRDTEEIWRAMMQAALEDKRAKALRELAELDL